MFLIKLLILLSIPLSSQSSELLKPTSFLQAENSNNSSFNPFIEYGEFQDNVTEQESINFFLTGRTLNISVVSGYEAITLNMRQIYGDSPGITGLSVGFFFDLNLALHIGGSFPHNHYNSLINSTSSFSNISIDLKYYFNKQKLTKSAAEIFNPYIIFGPFWMTISYDAQSLQTNSSPPAVRTNLQQTTPQGPVQTQRRAPISTIEGSTLSSFKTFGFKLGLGVEVPFIKKTYVGAEIAYLYTNLDFENRDLSKLDINSNNIPNKTFFNRLIFPNTPEVRGYLFYGDMITMLFIFGVNF